MKRKQNIYLGPLALLFLSMVVIGFQDYPLKRPPRAYHSVELFQGVEYTRRIRAVPRPLVIHTVSIDLTAPGLGFLVTPNDPGMEIAARTTSAFLREFGAQVAINGSFFEPFRARAPWDYYPRSGERVHVRGLAVSNSAPYSEPEEAWPMLCIAAGRVTIDRAGCPADTTQALAGNHLLVENRVPVVADDDRLHPRTAVAVGPEGVTLWLVVVDGRQRRYSEGVTLAELADIILELGADVAINLDGGGSSTLVAAGPRGPEVLNAPIHTGIRMRQRPVANHLGVYARPLIQGTE
ncbi:MAG TPA: phosphodiester glycosidase family protein [Anaerolineae bacterium]